MKAATRSAPASERRIKTATSDPTVTLSLSEDAVTKLFAGGNYSIDKGEDIGFNVALNALSHAALDLRIIGDAVAQGEEDHCYTNLDLANRIHWLMHQLEAAIELAQATHGKNLRGRADSEAQP